MSRNVLRPPQCVMVWWGCCCLYLWLQPQHCVSVLGRPSSFESRSAAPRTLRGFDPGSKPWTCFFPIHIFIFILWTNVNFFIAATFWWSSGKAWSAMLPLLLLVRRGMIVSCCSTLSPSENLFLLVIVFGCRLLLMFFDKVVIGLAPQSSPFLSILHLVIFLGQSVSKVREHLQN